MVPNKVFSLSFLIVAGVSASEEDEEDENGPAKKRKNPSNWKANVQKKRRMQGKSYVGKSQNGGEVAKEPRNMGPGCESAACRKSSKRFCNVITEKDRQDIFQFFWQRMDWDERKIYVAGLVDSTPVERRRSAAENSRRSTTLSYHLKVGGERKMVCKTMFLATLGIGEWSVQHWVQVGEPKEKTRRIPRNEAHESLRAFLRDLPKVPSHYCRSSSSKMYLEPVFQSISDLHRVYSRHCEEQLLTTPLSRQVFAEEFNQLNLALYHPKKDQCDTCCSYKAGNVPEDVWQTHCLKKEEARKDKEEDKQKGKQNEKLMVVCMDLQALLLCPKLKASAVYYKTKLAVHNFTVYNMVNHDGTCFVWHEGEGGLSANEFASCIVDYLSQHDEYVEYILWSDGCGYQNRNTTLTNALINFATANNKVVTQKFLERGHTQMECDSVHSVIERRLKDQDIHVPAEYVSVMKKARTKPKAYEVKYLDHGFFSDFSKLKHCKSIRPGMRTGDATVHDLRAIRYNINGTMDYKLQHSDDWTPFLRRDLRNTDDNATVTPLHTTSLTIKEAKYKHLQQLKEVMPIDFHSFYDVLIH